MYKISAPEITSYAGGVTAITASITLTEVGVIVGIITALLTCVFNMVYMYRKDQREQKRLNAELDCIELQIGGHKQ